MFGFRPPTVIALLAVLITGCTGPGAGRSTAWHPLPLKGVSGLAPAGSGRWIAVSDAKKPGEPRAILIQRTPQGALTTSSLRWVGFEPVDLEAISAVPGNADRFLAVTSKGEWFAIQLGNNAVQVVESGTLPESNLIKELEGFSLAPIGGRLVAIWGNRGSDTEPGRLFWSDWTGNDGASFSAVQSAEVQVPWPTKNVRHLSDLRLDPNGRVLASSASDPGDKGPFTAAVWEIGRFESSPAGLIWKPRVTPRQLLREAQNNHKIEAISADDRGRLVVASDDEDLGSAIRF